MYQYIHAYIYTYMPTQTHNQSTGLWQHSRIFARYSVDVVGSGSRMMSLNSKNSHVFIFPSVRENAPFAMMYAFTLISMDLFLFKLQQRLISFWAMKEPPHRA